MEAYDSENDLMMSIEEFTELLHMVENESRTMDAYTVEKRVFQKLLALGLSLMKLYFGKRSEEFSDRRTLEDEQGIEYPRERMRTRPYYSIFGELSVERLCFRQKGKGSIIPLDGAVNMPERMYSYFLQEMMSSLSQRMPFGEEMEFFKKYFGHSFSPRSLEAVNRDVASGYDAFYDETPPSPTGPEGTIQVVGFDGKGVPMVKDEIVRKRARLGKGEKNQKKMEALVGVSYSIDQHERTAEDVVSNLFQDQAAKPENEKRPIPRPCNKLVTVSLEKPKETVMEFIVKDVTERSKETKREMVCVLDGARSLWLKCRKLFPQAIFVLDIIHVLEYLWVAAYVYHKEGSVEAQHWVRDHLLMILTGRTGQVIKGLKLTLARRKLKKDHQKALKKVVGYFERNKRGMRYDLYLHRGYPIGTGVIESACGHVVKDRMEGSGMRWKIPSAEAMLRLRSLTASRHYDVYFTHYMSRQKERLYEKQCWRLLSKNNEASRAA